MVVIWKPLKSKCYYHINLLIISVATRFFSANAWDTFVESAFFVINCPSKSFCWNIIPKFRILYIEPQVWCIRWTREKKKNPQIFVIWMQIDKRIDRQHKYVNDFNRDKRCGRNKQMRCKQRLQNKYKIRNYTFKLVASLLFVSEISAWINHLFFCKYLATRIQSSPVVIY